LLEERAAARAARDFARADGLRDEILAAGFVVKDTPEGQQIKAAPRFQARDPATIPNELGDPPSIEFSLHLLCEGFPDDVDRFLNGFARHNDVARAEVVVVDNGSDAGEWLEERARAHPFVRVVHLDRECGWATARNAGLKGARGEFIVLIDLSIEPAGDILTPLRAVLANPKVGVAGPYGLRSDDMRSWHEDPGPVVHAVEGYLLATRRGLLAQGLIHEKFRWYRNADIDLSFQLRALGTEAVRVELPVLKHTHRGWTSVPEDERDKRSRRNHYLFFDRWKNHPLAAGAMDPDQGPGPA